MNKKYKCVKQVDETDCGAASVASICLYYGKNIDLSEIRKIAKVDKYGTSMFGLFNAAKALGFDSEGLSGSLNELKNENIKFPCIAHVIIDEMLEHFVVIFEITDDGDFIIGDPAKGIVNYTSEEFESIWTGYVLTMVPNKEFKKERFKKNELYPFFKMVLNRKSKFVIVAVLSFITAILSIAISAFSYFLIDFLINV